MSKSYYPLPSMTMQCRLYLNKEQKEKVDRILDGMRIVYNTTLYAMINEFRFTKEKKVKGCDDIVHFPDIKQMWEFQHLDELRRQYPIVNEIPASAISSNNGIFVGDMKRMLCKLYENATGKESNGKNLPVEKMGKVNYICKKHPRRSYTYQEKLNKISFSENKNVIYMSLNKLGKVKIRGWNKQIRFDKDGKIDFKKYCINNPQKQVTISIVKDKCGDYTLNFKFSVDKKGKGIIAYREYTDRNITEKVGIDVGKKSLATLSDGTVYENKRFKKKEDGRLKIYARKLSRMEGWKNPDFRERHKSNPELMPSKRYIALDMRNKKLHRKISRKRNNYNNFVSYRIVDAYGFIGIESLDISEMFGDPRTDEQKDINSSNFIPKRYVCREHDNTADAAMGQLLGMISYKSICAGRACVPIGKWFPSSKTCHVCGNIKKDLTLADRFWTCDICGTVHERDENAAKCIEDEAWNLFVKNMEMAS